MSGGARNKNVTLMLRGGHAIRLGGAVNLETLVEFLNGPSDGIIDIQSELTDRLLLRGDALLGVFETSADFTGNTLRSGFDQAASNRRYILFENLLTPEEHRKVIDRVLLMERSFEPSKVTTGRDDYRKSVLITEDEVVAPMFRRIIKSAALNVTQSLGLDLRREPEENQIECQVTAHNNGGILSCPQ